MYCNGSEGAKAALAPHLPQNQPKTTALQAKLRIMKPIRLLRLLFSAAAFFICTASMAQYQWIDANGRKVFSDQPPPASVPARKIVQQPGKAVPAIVSTEADTDAGTKSDATPAATAPAAAKPKAVDKELEAKKKQADDELAAKKKADQEALTKARIENCARAKSAKAGLDSGLRINQINTKGEREVMDDATRAAETKRVKSIIESDCK